MDSKTRLQIAAALQRAAHVLSAGGRAGVTFVFSEAKMTPNGRGSFVVQHDMHGEFSISEVEFPVVVDVENLHMHSITDKAMCRSAGQLLLAKQDLRKQLPGLVNEIDLLSFLEGEEGDFPTVRVEFKLSDFKVNRDVTYSDDWMRKPLGDGFNVEADTSNRGVVFEAMAVITGISGVDRRLSSGQANVSRRKVRVLFDDVYFKASSTCRKQYESLDFDKDDDGDKRFGS